MYWDLPCCFLQHLHKHFKDSLLHAKKHTSKGYYALHKGTSPSWHSLPNQFKRILFQAHSFVGRKNGTKTSSCFGQDPVIAPPLTQKTWQWTSFVVFRRTLVQRITIQCRQQPTMHRNTRGGKGEGAHFHSIASITSNCNFLLESRHDKLQNLKHISHSTFNSALVMADSFCHTPEMSHSTNT